MVGEVGHLVPDPAGRRVGRVRHAVWIVVDQLCRAPDHLAAELAQPGQRGVPVVRQCVGEGGAIGRHPLREAGERLIPLRLRGRLHQRADRIGPLAVPVAVEASLRVRCHRADRQEVEVAVADLLPQAEVVVDEVASADDRHLAVRDEQLVVHAAVELGEAPQELRYAHPPARERVEHAYLDVGVGVDRLEGGVLAAGPIVVDEQAHAHAAIGGGDQPIEQHAADRVATPHEILSVDARLRRVSHRHPRLDAALARVEQEEARLARVLRHGRGGQRAERRMARVHQRARRRTVDVLGQPAPDCRQGDEDPSKLTHTASSLFGLRHGEPLLPVISSALRRVANPPCRTCRYVGNAGSGEVRFTAG